MAKVKQGDVVIFNGYVEGEEPEDTLLEEGQEYVVESTDAATKTVVLRVENPEFNPDEDEDESTNPEFIFVESFFDEVSLKEPPKPAKAEAVEKPAPRGRAKKEKAKEESEAEKPVKAKAVEKPKAGRAAKPEVKPAVKPVKAEKKAAVKSEPEPEVDKYSDLEDEDAEVLALIGESSASEVAEMIAEMHVGQQVTDYNLGGLIYHLRKSKEYQSLDPRYAQKADPRSGQKSGFALFLEEHARIGYRKAMNLVEIYYYFTRAGLGSEAVAQIGWTKASKIAGVITSENADELVALASEKTVTDLVNEVNSTYKETSESVTRRRKIVISFKLYEDSAVTVRNILERAGAALSLDKPEELFERIVSEWALQNLEVSEEAQPDVEPGVVQAPVAAKPARRKVEAKA